MSRMLWEQAKSVVNGYKLEIGPYFAHQMIENPRHILFTFSRYKFAERVMPLENTKDVLELGCNEGLGSLFLSERANSFVGVDFDESAIAYASSNMESEKSKFICDNFLKKKYGNFDVVVSLDVVEHIERAVECDYFNTIVLNLKRDGMCVVGTPNIAASQYASESSRVGHVNLYSFERMYSEMKKYFANVLMFGMNDEVVHTGFHPMCHYIFAVGCSPRESSGV